MVTPFSHPSNLPRKIMEACFFIALAVLGSVHASGKDRVAPSVPTNLTASEISPSGFILSWSPSTDNVGVTGYEVFLNGVTQGTAAATSRTFSGLQAATTYTATVRARDAAANWSAHSAPLSVVTLADSEPPTAPTNLAASNISQTGFTLTWTASVDNVGIAGYDIQGIGFNSDFSVSVSGNVTSRLISGLQAGTLYSVTISARDFAGNRSATSSPLEVATVAVPLSESFSMGARGRNVAISLASGELFRWGSVSWPSLHAPASQGSLDAAQVTVGAAHLLVLRRNGTVLAWGDNSYGQTAGASLTVEIPKFTGVKGVAAGANHSLAVKTDGTIFGWGANSAGQVGNGRTTNVSSPTRIGRLTGIAQVAAGDDHSLALRTDGTVLAWGSNAHGEVGNGTNVNQTAPVVVTGLGGVSAIAAGGSHTLALKTDGTVWAWGLNSAGQLGDGTSINRRTPVQVPGLSGIIEIAAGAEHSVARKSDGSLWAWGSNSHGQLGDGTYLDRHSPTRVVVVSSAAALVAGGNVTFGVHADGIIRSWGQSGLLGDGDPGIRNSPFQLPYFNDVAQVAVSYGTQAVTLLRRDGTVWASGPNHAGELANGGTRPRFGLGLIESLQDVVQIEHRVALTRDGRVWTWGPNDRGRLGDGGGPDRYTPAPVPGLHEVIRIAAQSNHVLALKADGTVWAWGANDDGQLGDGTNVQRNSPVQMVGLSDVVDISAGWLHSMMVKSDGSVWACGWGGSHLGLGYNETKWEPTRTLFENAVRVSAGTQHTLVLTASGVVYGAGSNIDGQVGSGPWWGSSTPLLVPGLAGIIDIATFGNGSLALLSDGTVRGWGSGYGTVPRAVSGLPSSVVSLGSDGCDKSAILVDGSAWVWNGAYVKPAGFRSMASQIADLRILPSILDVDGDGLSDAWELAHFGDLSASAAADSDADGLTNVQEFLRGTDPLVSDSDGDGLRDSADEYPEDFFNNVAPVLAVVGGDAQEALPGQFNLEPFDVAVWSADGVVPLINAPVVFSVVAGGGLLGEAREELPALLPELGLITDEHGTARAFYRQPSSAGVISTIRVTAGASQVEFSSTSTSPGADSDGNGLPDSWEMHYFGVIGVDPHADADGDGVSNLQEYLNGTSPIDYYNGVLPQISSLLIDGSPGADGAVSVLVARVAGGVPLVNAPVTFSMVSGANEISSAPGGAPAVLITVRTNAEGVAKVHLLAPVSGLQRVLSEAASGDQHVSLTLRLKPAAITDTDGNGLPDWWEIKHFGTIGVDPAADPDGDGASNRLEFERGTLPGVPDLPPGDPASLRLFTPLSR